MSASGSRRRDQERLPPARWWSDLSLQTSEGWLGLREVTLRADGQYRRYKLLLTLMGLAHKDFNGMIRGLRVGSQWRRGSVIRIDWASVRW